MGQENSHQMIDPDTPPNRLSSRSLEAIAEYIKNGSTEKIVVMTGAGISTSAGIPDFRSPETGLYANLARLDLPYAEAVFDISYFRGNPDPFYILAKELYPGKFYPTITHVFIALLEKKSLLQMLFTQNIDCLERQAGVSESKIVEAHGSFATQRCIDCKTEYPDDLMKQAVERGDVPHCIVPQCNGLVKPDIVFFGEALPEAFHQNRHVPTMADLVIVMGTSLSVHPFASLPQLASEGVPRLLFNKDQVGDFGSRPDDVIVLGDCDDCVCQLADALGWRDELEEMYMEVSGKFREKEATALQEERAGMSKDDILEAEIEKLTSEVDAALQLSKAHEQRINKHLEKSGGSSITPLADATNKPEVLENPTAVKQSPPSSAATTLSAKSAVETELPENSANPVSNAQAITGTALPSSRPDKEPTDSKI